MVSARTSRWTLVAAACVLWAASAALGADQSPYVGDPGQALATLVIFAVLLVVLGRFAWKPIVSQIRQRERLIADSLAKSEKRDKDSAELLEQYGKRLEHAQSEAAEMLARSRREAADARQEILDTARAEAAQYGQRIRDDIEQAKQSALRELRHTTAELAVEAAGQVLGRTIDDADQDRLIDDTIAQLRRDGQDGQK